MSTSTTYFVIYSNTSRNGMGGLRPEVMWTFESSIVEAAAWELQRSGESLEDMAGIAWIEDADGNMKPARDLSYDEILAWSVEKLGDDGRVYITFNTDEAGAAEFIEAAEYHSLGDKARAVVENFNS